MTSHGPPSRAANIARCSAVVTAALRVGSVEAVTTHIRFRQVRP